MSNLRIARTRKILATVALLVISAIVVLACDIFNGPVTKAGPEQFFTCEDGLQKCLIGREYCSSTKPQRCITDWARTGASRDAGPG